MKQGLISCYIIISHIFSSLSLLYQCLDWNDATFQLATDGGDKLWLSLAPEKSRDVQFLHDGSWDSPNKDSRNQYHYMNEGSLYEGSHANTDQGLRRQSIEMLIYSIIELLTFTLLTNKLRKENMSISFEKFKNDKYSSLLLLYSTQSHGLQTWWWLKEKFRQQLLSGVRPCQCNQTQIQISITSITSINPSLRRSPPSTVDPVVMNSLPQQPAGCDLYSTLKSQWWRVGLYHCIILSDI